MLDLNFIQYIAILNGIACSFLLPTQHFLPLPLSFLVSIDLVFDQRRPGVRLEITPLVFTGEGLEALVPVDVVLKSLVVLERFPTNGAHPLDVEVKVLLLGYGLIQAHGGMHQVRLVRIVPEENKVELEMKKADILDTFYRSGGQIF